MQGQESAVSQVHLYVTVLDADGVGAYGNDGWQHSYLPGRDVKAGAVTRALDLVAEEDAFAQRAAVVRADVVEGEEAPFDVGDGNAVAVHVEDAHFTGLDIEYLCHALERHL